MAQRLNLLFQTAPRQFLERTVLFTDQLSFPDTRGQMRNRTVHHIDLQPVKQRSSARLVMGLHEYQDAPLTSYFALPGIPTFLPKEDPPFRFVFFPEFAGCRLLVQAEGPDWLKLSVEEGLAGPLPPPEATRDSIYLDSFAYWDHTHGDLIGHIRGTAVLVKERDQPWTVFLQQIVGTVEHEVVRSLFSRPIRY